MSKITIFLTFVLVVGCTPVIEVQSLANLQLGMTHDEVSELYGERAVVTLPITTENGEAMIDVYYLQNGDYRSDYFLAYERDGALLFWGYPHEFARSIDPHINAIGVAAVPAWQAEVDRMEAERQAAREALRD